MHGIGNDFVLIDAVRATYRSDELPALARSICDRRFGIGSDGLILAERGTTAPFRMRMFNPDGSESEMCGNGVRCFLKFLHEEDLATENSLSVETGAGLLSLELMDTGKVRVDMGMARLSRQEIGMLGDPESSFILQPIAVDDRSWIGTAVSMGNPHLVILVDDAQAVPLESWGPMIERHPWFPNRVNVHFVQIIDRGHLIQRTWERGAGVTLACGTGACASAVAAALAGRAERAVKIDLPGGQLDIEYLDNGRVMMTGPAETVFVGTY